MKKQTIKDMAGKLEATELRLKESANQHRIILQNFNIIKQLYSDAQIARAIDTQRIEQLVVQLQIIQPQLTKLNEELTEMKDNQKEVNEPSTSE